MANQHLKMQQIIPTVTWRTTQKQHSHQTQLY